MTQNLTPTDKKPDHSQTSRMEEPSQPKQKPTDKETQVKPKHDDHKDSKTTR
jgi:hypothetical protein